MKRVVVAAFVALLSFCIFAGVAVAADADVAVAKVQTSQQNCTPANNQEPTLMSVLPLWAPMLLLVGGWMVFLRRLKKAGPDTVYMQQRSLAHMEKAEKLLEEILEATKRKT